MNNLTAIFIFKYITAISLAATGAYLTLHNEGNAGGWLIAAGIVCALFGSTSE